MRMLFQAPDLFPDVFQLQESYYRRRNTIGLDGGSGIGPRFLPLKFHGIDEENEVGYLVGRRPYACRIRRPVDYKLRLVTGVLACV